MHRQLCQPDSCIVAVECASLRAITDAEGFGEIGAIVGIDGGAVPCATDRDVDRSRIDGVRSERLQMGEHLIARSALA